MSDEAALLAAIRVNYQEDTPRLVYADWLDEHATNEADRARAEFIRVNSEVLQLNGDYQAPECTEHWWRLVNRQHELVERYQREWFSQFPFPEVLQPSDFWCGFPKHIDLVAIH